MEEWCVDNNLVLNTTKTNEILMDFRRSKRTTQTPLTINGEEVERVDSVKFLGTYNTKDLTWATNIPNLVKRAQSDHLKRKARSVSTDKTHPGHTLFVPLPSGKRYRTLQARTTRLRNSFFPRAVASITPSTP